MKSSVKFREERSPLLRAKVPFKLGPIPLSSGIALGNKEELALHFATDFSCGPIIKLAFKPHDPTPLSVILKSGLGLWGSPVDAPFTLTSEICLAPKVQDCLLSLRIKPRLGDFSIRKDVKNVNLPTTLHSQKELATTSVRLQLHENGGENHPQKGENGFVSSSLSNGDLKLAPQQTHERSFDKEQLERSSVDSNNMLVGSNFSLRVEGLENEHKDHKSRLEGIKEENGEADLSRLKDSMIVHVPHRRLHEQMKKSSGKAYASFSLAGVHDALRGCRIITDSSLPVGSQSRINVRWGVSASADFIQGLDGSLPILSLVKLPSLLLEKVSFEQVASTTEKPSLKLAEREIRGSPEQGLFPASFVEENRELAQVSALCYTMKRQLHLMHAENQVLRRAMEDMKSHVDSKSSSSILNGVGDGMLKDGPSMPRRPQKNSTLGAPSPSWLEFEGGHRDVEAQKGKEAVPKREDLHSKSFSTVTDSENLSKELEKAILSAQTGLIVGKH